ncbi:hypothetical protein ACERK3_12215 [Phycisphaerales bacterium AB-hyl4]|uniref:Uncharacterized protein n=1 Tax=Natronomicrosphaera hydrolytica TaxID=3242702 RepID=A0ABV4U9V7_9BACT
MNQTSFEATRGARGARSARPAGNTSLRLLLLAMLSISLAGCGPLGWVAHGVAGGQKRVKIKADYTGLENQRVAVLVDVDEYTLHQHRQAPMLISREISTEIAEHVVGVQLVNPRDVISFQHDNPYWSTGRYTEIFEKLDVDRLVIVDLMDYRLHEPGNMHIYQGLLSGTVMVVEADARDPDQPRYSTTVRVEYPENSTIGAVSTNPGAIQGELITRFGLETGRLFHDHEVWQ